MVEHTISHTVLQLPSFNSTTKQALLPTWRVVSSSAAADEDSTPARFSACSPSATCRAAGEQWREPQVIHPHLLAGAARPLDQPDGPC